MKNTVGCLGLGGKVTATNRQLATADLETKSLPRFIFFMPMAVQSVNVV